MKNTGQFRASTRPLRPGSYLLSVEGELDLYTCAEVKALVGTIPDGVANLLVDLAAVSFIDSAGLGLLVGIAKRMRDRGGAVTLAVDDENILKILRITGFNRFFDVCSPAAV